MSERIVVIGGGGFAKEVISIAEINQLNIVGIIAKETSINRYPLLSTTENDLINLKNQFDCVFLGIGVGSARDITKRRSIISYCNENNIKFGKIISPNAIIYSDVKIELGTFIGANVVIGNGAEIGKNVILNTSSLIGHDTKIDENSCIAPNCFLGGNVEIEQDVLIGAGSMIMQGKKIGQGSTVGMGSSVLKDVEKFSILFPRSSMIKKLPEKN